MRYGKIVLYKEWLCTVCGEVYPHDRGLPKSGKPTNCEHCYYMAHPVAIAAEVAPAGEEIE